MTNVMMIPKASPEAPIEKGIPTTAPGAAKAKVMSPAVNQCSPSVLSAVANVAGNGAVLGAGNGDCIVVYSG